MARGQHFNHKNKNHPGEFPKNAFMAEKKTEEAPGDEELIVVQEAFKNRMEEEEQRQDTGRWLPEQTEQD
ncbi:hypothetical protein [Bacillus sp. FJAT-29814]|uniref:hypothetical protein n=1 Tax=Bacillus sp. FJAT-29814 TaxID=1729688 RepID=UPI00083441C3|nr:hypothetical protein [Bacillus sp. FJAT-29814]